MGQIITTQNLVAIKVVRHSGQWIRGCYGTSHLQLTDSWFSRRLFAGTADIRSEQLWTIQMGATGLLWMYSPSQEIYVLLCFGVFGTGNCMILLLVNLEIWSQQNQASPQKTNKQTNKKQKKKPNKLARWLCISKETITKGRGHYTLRVRQTNFRVVLNSPMCVHDENAYCSTPHSPLTHWGRDKMAAISQKTSCNAFSWMTVYEFRLRFHWSLIVPKCTINNIPALVHIMAWRRIGEKPLSEPRPVDFNIWQGTSLLTHICVTRSQWGNLISAYVAAEGAKYWSRFL